MQPQKLVETVSEVANIKTFLGGAGHAPDLPSLGVLACTLKYTMHNANFHPSSWMSPSAYKKKYVGIAEKFLLRIG